MIVERLTPDEKQEFSELKRIRCKRGFFMPNEEQRYNELWDKNAKAVMVGLKFYNTLHNQMENN